MASGHGEVYTPDPFHHTQDSNKWEFFEHLFGTPIEIALPKLNLGIAEIQVTKFMILQLVAAGIILAIYIPLSRRIATGALPTGLWWNFFEFLLVFIRDYVARPSIGGGHTEHTAEHAPEPKLELAGEVARGGSADNQVNASELSKHATPSNFQEHPADAYVPYLWTLFLFILVCNLLGAFPFLGSPTASIGTTAGLALLSYIVINLAVIQRTGVRGFLKTLWFKVDMPPGVVFTILGFLITLMLSVIETAGLIAKAVVLAIRLFANMLAGHLVMGYLLLFVYLAGKALGPGLLWGGISIASILATTAIGLLEIFVAFLQAFIFTFLTAIFLGMQVAHAEHH
ncbi:MAG: F0F1 ATP synthase subunit A [Gemmataceae bacterium]